MIKNLGFLEILSISILSRITFMLFINRGLRRVPCLTSLALDISLCGLMPFTAIYQSPAVHQSAKAGREAAAVKPGRVCIWVFPFVFLIICFTVISYCWYNLIHGR